jgi:hypothetical protein
VLRSCERSSARTPRRHEYFHKARIGGISTRPVQFRHAGRVITFVRANGDGVRGISRLPMKNLVSNTPLSIASVLS